MIIGFGSNTPATEAIALGSGECKPMKGGSHADAME
jgi:hypothetical protein